MGIPTCPLYPLFYPYPCAADADTVAARNDLSGVLAKFPGAKRTGMSRRTRITSLHTTIGPGAKALPPPPPKARKKVEEEDDDDSETEGKVKVGSREWLMMED
jgi:hypothetical protein